ncbi:MAG: hypothetical protein R2818_12515 [Flavobacteriales bacterium]
MERIRFAVLDVETTSGDPKEGRVMGSGRGGAGLGPGTHAARTAWCNRAPGAFVHPQAHRRRQRLLQDAPSFTEVVRTLGTLTQDRIVVAHNVRSTSALEHEFARTGLVFDRPTLYGTLGAAPGAATPPLQPGQLVPLL